MTSGSGRGWTSSGVRFGSMASSGMRGLASACLKVTGYSRSQITRLGDRNDPGDRLKLPREALPAITPSTRCSPWSTGLRPPDPDQGGPVGACHHVYGDVSTARRHLERPPSSPPMFSRAYRRAADPRRARSTPVGFGVRSQARGPAGPMFCASTPSTSAIWVAASAYDVVDEVTQLTPWSRPRTPDFMVPVLKDLILRLFPSPSRPSTPTTAPSPSTAGSPDAQPAPLVPTFTKSRDALGQRAGSPNGSATRPQVASTRPPARR